MSRAYIQLLMNDAMVMNNHTVCPSICSHSDMPTMLGVPLKSGVPFDAGICPSDSVLDVVDFGLPFRRRLSMIRRAFYST